MSIESVETMSIPQSDLAKSIAERAHKQAEAGSGIKELQEGRSDTFRLNPYHIKVKPGFNSREFEGDEIEEHIDSLAKSIAENGVRRSLLVFKEGEHFYLEDGECRLRATYRAIEEYGAEILTIPVQVSDKRSSESDRVLSQIILNSGKPLTVLEQCTVFRKLQNFGWNTKEIASKTALTEQRINQILDLAALPETAKQYIRKGQIAPTLAGQVFRQNADDSSRTVEVLTAAVETAAAQGKTRATAKHLATAPKKPKRFETVITEAFAGAIAVPEHDDEGDPKSPVVGYTISISVEDFDRIKPLLDIHVSQGL